MFILKIGYVEGINNLNINEFRVLMLRAEKIRGVNGRKMLSNQEKLSTVYSTCTLKDLYSIKYYND